MRKSPPVPPANDAAGMEARKDQHIDIVLEAAVEHRAGTLLDAVTLIHQSLPELALDEIRLDTRLLGRKIAAPLLITGMTGGSERAGRINRDLAAVAQQLGLPLGVGSMRPLLQDPGRRADYDLREIATDVPLFGNLGVMQAALLAPAHIRGLLDELGYDALCLHLNPAQELAQPEGDRDFRGAVETIQRYVGELGQPVIVKETGAGLSPQALDRIRGCGVDWVDVSGRGGTSWTRVEGLRPGADAFGDWFGDWGIPTAASLIWARRRGFRTIASGGIRNVHDVLRALALGAELAGMARPVLQLLEEGGVDGAVAGVGALIEGLRRGMLLCGAADRAALAVAPRHIGPALQSWLAEPATGSRGRP